MARERTQRRRGGVTTTIPRTRVRPRPPDVRGKYVDPRVNLRPTMFGLTLDEYRAEYRRRQGERWASWELKARFPAPAVSP